MAGIDFDRQAFVSAAEKPPRFRANLVGPAILIAAIVVAGIVAYKIISTASSGAVSPPSDTASLMQVRQQLEEIQERLDTLEKHRKAGSPEPAKAPENVASASVAKIAPARPAYKIASGIPQPIVNRPPPVAPGPSASQQAAIGRVEQKTNANHEAWQATTDRLADVVGVVGTQQGEISQTREDVDRLLAKTGRSAVQFEVRRNAGREPVGPVSILLKNADTRNNKYSLCIYVGDQCIELKNRAVNEVVAFVVSKDSVPLALVATKILHDQIVGYLEVPNGKPAL
jgi:hypothetical protein